MWGEVGGEAGFFVEKLVCLVGSGPRCVVIDICQCSCLGSGHLHI